MSLLIQCLLMALLGVIVQYGFRAEKLRKQFIAANQVFILQRYLKDEAIGIIISVAVVCMALLGMDELVKISKYVNDYTKWFFALIGWGGANIIQGLFSKTEQYIMDVIDRKTNIADKKTQNDVGKPQSNT